MHTFQFRDATPKTILQGRNPASRRPSAARRKSEHKPKGRSPRSPAAEFYRRNTDGTKSASRKNYYRWDMSEQWPDFEKIRNRVAPVMTRPHAPVPGVPSRPHFPPLAPASLGYVSEPQLCTQPFAVSAQDYLGLSVAYAPQGTSPGYWAAPPEPVFEQQNLCFFSEPHGIDNLNYGAIKQEANLLEGYVPLGNERPDTAVAKQEEAQY